MTSPHDPDNTSPSSPTDETDELPLFDHVPDDRGVPLDAGQPVDQEPTPRRRWSRGHTIAAAFVAAGALVTGGAAAGAHYADSTNTSASGQPPVGPNGAQQDPSSPPDQGRLPGQDPLASLGQLDVGQLDGLIKQLSDGELDSDQLRALLALFGLPDHVDAGQLRDLLQQLDGGNLLDGAGDTGSGVET